MEHCNPYNSVCSGSWMQISQRIKITIDRGSNGDKGEERTILRRHDIGLTAEVRMRYEAATGKPRGRRQRNGRSSSVAARTPRLAHAPPAQQNAPLSISRDTIHMLSKANNNMYPCINTQPGN